MLRLWEGKVEVEGMISGDEPMEYYVTRAGMKLLGGTGDWANNETQWMTSSRSWTGSVQIKTSGYTQGMKPGKIGFEAELEGKEKEMSVHPF